MKKIFYTFIFIFIFSFSALAVNLTDFGAIPNDRIDDSPALQSAFNYVCNRGGGEIVFPDGITLLKSETGGNCHFASHLIFRSKSGESVIELETLPTYQAFAVGNLGSFVAKDLLFIGFTDRTDARHVFFITAQTAKFDNLIFANLHVERSVVKTHFSTNAVFENCQFAGIGGGAAIEADTSPRLVVRNSIFIDYFNYKNVYYGKSWWGVNAWIKSTNSIGHARAVPSVLVEGNVFDEAAYNALYVSDTESVIFTGNQTNVNNQTDAFGVKVIRAKAVKINDNRFGYVNTPKGAAHLVDVNRFTIENNFLYAGVGFFKVSGEQSIKGVIRNTFREFKHGAVLINESNAEVEID